jgi:hypothetical protein
MTIAQQLLAEGEARGEARGLRVSLKRMLTLRFGAPDAATVARLEAASGDQLERWLDRVLGAASASDVIADP